MLNLVDLTGKRILVAGASQGIGGDTAIMLSKLGAQCVLVARNEEKLKGIMAQLEGEGHSMYAADLSVLDNHEELAKTIVADGGAIDGIVYSAGMSDDRPLSLMKPDKVEEVLRLNLAGFFEIIRVFTKRKRFNPGLAIVGLSSTAAFKGTKAHSVYAATKAGMNGAIKGLAREYADKGVRINTVAPGMIRTAMYDAYLEGCGGEDSDAVKKLLGAQFLGIGETEDVASAIAFLLSPASRFITGVCLPVDGGSLA